MCGCENQLTIFDLPPTRTVCSSRWQPAHLTILWIIFVVSLLSPVCCEDYHGSSDKIITYFTAFVNITYRDHKSEMHSDAGEIGKYGPNSLVETESGLVVHVRDKDNKTNGCSDYNIQFPSEKWIALIARGSCTFTAKIKKASKKYNASAVVIYNTESSDSTSIMQHTEQDVVSITISKEDGLRIAKLVDNKIKVYMHIGVGNRKTHGTVQPSISKTSVLFVSISFIVLMIISLAWLVFYYIQRFRYAHAKERLARRLASAAKKAIAKIPQKNVKSGDKEMDSEFDQCAVCIEGYKTHDVIRTLPCKHVFHKSCVDPWLLDQRSCPMCKLDILRAYGMHVGGSQDSVHPDGESGVAMGAVEELEQTSVGEEQELEGEVKILLLPPNHVCLHREGETSGERSPSVVSSHVTVENSVEESIHSSDSECTELQSLMTDYANAIRLDPQDSEQQTTKSDKEA